MFDLLCMSTLFMFLFLMKLGIIFGLLLSSWDLFAVSVAGVLTCWILLCLRRD